ncbi:MAG: hypothetical protein Q8R15_01480, partial [Candidatus Micrarchaeota archaeon]|nr:hypothetical protein [Candidatus Micrarchaeota archaeon]
WQNSTVRLVGASVPWFTGVTCIDENVVYAVGLNGVIVKTANGGERWQWVHGNRDASDESLQAISCTDANTCWAVGLGSTVLKTGNSGETWEQQPVIGNSFFDVFFLDSTHGWVAGDVGRIRRTIDGATWTNQTLDAFSSLRSIYFINETHGWTASSSIKFTNNSGENWYAESTDRLSLPIMRGLDFPSSQVGWLVGDEGVILRYGQPSERGNLSIGYPDRMVYSVNRTQTCQSDLDECVNQINQTCTFIASRPTEEQAAQCRIDAQGDCNNDYQACLAGELTDASSEVQQGAEEGEGQREQPIEADELTQEEINQDAQTEQQSRQQAQVAFNPVQSVVSIVQGAVNWFAKLFGG